MAEENTEPKPEPPGAREVPVEEIQKAKLQINVSLKVKIKSKFIKWGKKKPIQLLLNADVTPIFLFLGLHLFGFPWDWKVLLASIGTWIVVKEVFKLIRSHIVTAK